MRGEGKLRMTLGATDVLLPTRTSLTSSWAIKRSCTSCPSVPPPVPSGPTQQKSAPPGKWLPGLGLGVYLVIFLPKSVNVFIKWLKCKISEDSSQKQKHREPIPFGKVITPRAPQNEDQIPFLSINLIKIVLLVWKWYMLIFRNCSIKG